MKTYVLITLLALAGCGADANDRDQLRPSIECLRSGAADCGETPAME